MVLKPLKIMNDPEIVKEGHLKRLKTLKKRYFVLRSSPKKGKTRLEYYESQKKFRRKNPPKRVIYLDTCFNIARKEDSKNRPVFVLYTCEDVFGLIANSEDELNSWIKSLEIEKRKEEILNASVSTWPVTIKPRGLGTSKNLSGQFDLQLSNRTLSFVTKDTRDSVMELELVNIRRCGHTDCFFFMELGRSAATGAGELWIQVDDQIIAQNMHETIHGSMHNISISGDIPRRRCASEGRRPKGRPRPISAVINPMGRGRSGTEPNLSVLPNHSYSTSTRDLCLTDSPKSEMSSVLNRLIPRRKSKDGTGSLDSSCHSQEETSSDFNDKVLMSPPCTSPPSLLPKSSQPEYVNVGPNGIDEAGSTEDYMKMIANRRRTSDSYIDMQPTKSQAMQALRTKTTQTTPSDENLNMTSLRQDAERQDRNLESPGMRSEFVQQKKSSSPRQLRTNDSALPNKPDIREFVYLKKSISPGAVRRNPNQDYADMKPHTVAKDVSRLNVNFMPSTNTKEFSSKSDLTGRREQSSYVNVAPGEDFEKRGKQLKSHTPKNGLNGAAESSSYEEMHSYVNFNPGKIQDKKPAYKDFRKHSLESVLSEKSPEYMNIDLSGITKSRSAVDMPEYVNFVPGRIFDNSEIESCATTGETEESKEIELNGAKFALPKVVVESERWRKSPRSRRRESEPVGLEQYKCMANSTLSSTKEDEETTQLNYVVLDLSKSDSSTPESPSLRRTRPPNIDLSSCHRAQPGPRSAPVKSAYAEVDFTKSDGIRQARQTRELANIT